MWDLDIVSEGIPLAIRGGMPDHWPEFGSMLLAEEEIYAVAGPSCARAPSLPRTVEDFASHRLIHIEERYREAAEWGDWFASAGIAPDLGTRGLLINDYVLVIQAVMEGQGIALGWRHLSERLIDAGLLVRVTDHSLRTGKGFYVVWPKARELSGSMTRVRDWLIDRA